MAKKVDSKVKFSSLELFYEASNVTATILVSVMFMLMTVSLTKEVGSFSGKNSLYCFAILRGIAKIAKI